MHDHDPAQEARVRSGASNPLPFRTSNIECVIIMCMNLLQLNNIEFAHLHRSESSNVSTTTSKSTTAQTWIIKAVTNKP